MKQNLQDIIRWNKELKKILQKQEDGIMKCWADHPDSEFDVDLFDAYENEIINA